jgi:hypothetical protein
MFQRAFGLALAANNYDVSYNLGRCTNYSLLYFESLPLSAAIDSVISEESFRYNEKYLRPAMPGTMIGFWQSEKYFAHIADNVRRAFTFKTSTIESVSRLAARVRGPNSIFLHVRRGDYVNLQYYHGMPSLDYYKNGVRQIRAMNSDAEVFVFSDDRSWCRENFPSDYYIIEGTDKFEDLYLMSLCQHAVIANSSFSWWGAWLRDARPRRMVIAPAQWFTTPTLDTQDLIPDRWSKL